MNKIRWLWLAITAALMFSVGGGCGAVLRAQDKGAEKIWKWEDAVRELERSNPYLISSRHSLVKSQYLLKGSYSAFLPSVGLSASAARKLGDDSNYDDSYSMGVSASLSLFAGFSDINTYRLRRNDITDAILGLRRARSDALYKLKTAFTNLLWSQEQLTLAEQIVDRRRKNRDLVALKYEGGREDKGSLLRVEADLIRAEYEERKARRDLENAANNFLRAMGIDMTSIPPDKNGGVGSARAEGNLNDILPSTSAFSVSGNNKPDVSGGSTLPNFIDLAAKTPEVMSANLRLENARLSVGISKSPFLPDLSLGASISRAGNVFPPDNENRSVSLGLSWNIFKGGKDYFNLMASNYEEKILEQNLNAVKLSVASSLENVWRSRTDAYENLEVIRKYLEAAETQTEIVTTKYLNGLVSYQEWYQVENDYISARKSLLNAVRDAVLSDALWKNTLGEDKNF